MKKIFLTIILSVSIFSLYGASSKAKATVPEWVIDTNAAYPSSEYLKATGYGSTKTIAENNALGNISKIFSTKVNSYTRSVKDFEYVVKTKSSELRSESLYSEINVVSDSDFFCVEFSTPYYDKKTKEYSVIAFINRKKAEAVYKEKISVILSQLKGLESSANDAKEPIIKCLIFHEAVLLGDIAFPLIQNSTIISGTNRYEKELKKINSFREEFNKIKKTITFSVKVADENTQSIIPSINSTLEKSGFIYSPKNGLYEINLNLKFEDPEYMEVGVFVRPVLICTVSNKNGEIIESYSKDYPKFTHQTLELAYSRALFKVKEDLEENFLSEYRGFN